MFQQFRFKVIHIKNTIFFHQLKVPFVTSSSRNKHFPANTKPDNNVHIVLLNPGSRYYPLPRLVLPNQQNQGIYNLSTITK